MSVNQSCVGQRQEDLGGLLDTNLPSISLCLKGTWQRVIGQNTQYHLCPPRAPKAHAPHTHVYTYFHTGTHMNKINRHFKRSSQDPLSTIMIYIHSIHTCIYAHIYTNTQYIHIFIVVNQSYVHQSVTVLLNLNFLNMMSNPCRVIKFHCVYVQHTLQPLIVTGHLCWFHLLGTGGSTAMGTD